MKTKNRVISLILVLNMLLFAFPFNSIAQDTITSSDDEVTENVSVENNIISDDNETSNYVEDEVLILLADTPQTQDMQFYSVYSDDFRQ